MKYKIVVPLYNEGKYIRQFLENMPEKHLSSLILINDGSTDKTAKIIADITKNSLPHRNLTLLEHKINLGKGKSMETGALRAIKERADVIIFMDGDMQHKPKDIDRFLRAFKKQRRIDIIFGARIIGKNMNLTAFVGNKLLTIIINVFFHYFLNDTQCGFRGFRSKVFGSLRWRSAGYAAETEMIIRAARNRLRCREITIDTVYLDHYKGTSILDGVKILSKIILWRFFK